MKGKDGKKNLYRCKRNGVWKRRAKSQRGSNRKRREGDKQLEVSKGKDSERERNQKGAQKKRGTSEWRKRNGGKKISKEYERKGGDRK